MPIDIVILAATVVRQVLIPFFQKSGQGVEDQKDDQRGAELIEGNSGYAL